MDNRVAVISLIVEKPQAVERLNSILHNYSGAIIGRLGLPYREKNVNIIALAVDAPQNVTSALSGKLGRLEGVAVKTVFANV